MGTTSDVIADRFEVERVAGEGGMGTVYRALDRLTGHPVAVKLIRGRLTSAAGRRFYREAQVLSTLEHPGIVRHVGHGVTGAGEMWLAMEWLEGLDLSSRLRLGWRPTLADALDLVHQAANALALAHSRDVVHRDVKPSNLFLVAGARGPHSRVKVVDFGLARATGTTQLTETGMILGTPNYMAPEQARGEDGVDGQVDVYALGCCLFELLTGRPPFTGTQGLAVLMKTLLEEPPRVSDLREAETPAVVDILVAALLAKDRDDRPANAEAVADAVAEIISGSHDGRPLLRTTPNPSLSARITASERRVVTVIASGGRWLGATAEMGVPRATPGPVEAWSALRDVVARYDAQLEQLVDGSLVVLMTDTGLPTEQAVRAARCALTMREVRPDVPVVVATGRALSQPGQPRGPVGEVIERAVERLYRLRAPVLGVDADTASLLPPRFDVAGEDDASLVLRAERDDGDELAVRTLLGQPTPFVGRRREVAQLEGCWDHAAGEPAAVAVLVSGGAGVGKSRLARELLTRVRTSDPAPTVLLGRAEALGGASPYALIGSAIRRWARIRAEAPPRRQHQALLAHIGRVVLDPAEAERAAAFIAEAIGLPHPTGDTGIALRAARRDARLMADQVRQAWLTWLEAECGAGPVLLVLEDMHWGDVSSLQLVDAALAALAEAPLMVVGLARPEVRERFPDLWRDQDLTTLAVRGLPKRAADQLTRHALGPDADDEVVRRVVDQADGNAFFLEELIRSAASDPTGALPDSVLGMVEARVASLGPDSRRLLRAASVFGATFGAPGVAALVGAEPDTRGVATQLEALASRELIARAGPAGSDSGAYRFRSGLLREAAYAMLTDEDRVLGHRLAGSFLESSGAAGPVALAEHYERGARRTEAGRWLGRAAKDALDGNDLVAALEHAARARACGVTGESLAAARLVEAEAFIFRGDIAAAVDAAAEVLGASAEGTAAWFRAMGYRVYGLSVLGREGELDPCVDALREVELADDDPLPSVMALTQAAYSQHVRGRYQDAADFVADAEGIAEGAGPLVEGRLAGVRAQIALSEGDVADAARHYEDAVERYVSCQYLRRACGMRISLGFCYSQGGRWDAAREQLQRGAAEAEALGLSHVVATAWHNLGLVLARCGQHESAREMEQRSISALNAEGDVRLEGAAHAYLALILRAAGDVEGAEAEARVATELLDAFPPVLILAYATLAEALLAQRRVDEALTASRRGMGHLLGLGGEAEEGESQLRLVHAQALRAAGDHVGACATISAARDRLLHRASRMTDANFRAGFLSDVPENSRTLALAAAWTR